MLVIKITISNSFKGILGAIYTPDYNTTFVYISEAMFGLSGGWFDRTQEKAFNATTITIVRLVAFLI